MGHNWKWFRQHSFGCWIFRKFSEITFLNAIPSKDFNFCSIYRVKSKRRFIGPNPGFVQQLRLFYKMGWKIDIQHEQYKTYRLRLAADKVRKGSVHTHKPKPNQEKCQFSDSYSENFATILHGPSQTRSRIGTNQPRTDCVSMQEMSTHCRIEKQHNRPQTVATQSTIERAKIGCIQRWQHGHHDRRNKRQIEGKLIEQRSVIGRGNREL